MDKRLPRGQEIIKPIDSVIDNVLEELVSSYTMITEPVVNRMNTAKKKILKRVSEGDRQFHRLCKYCYMPYRDRYGD